jgi:pimeloyl-ACP methyl ester carboxylesterase
MVAEFVGEIGKRCSLWGWSAGCGVGLHAAAQSDQIDRMILMGPHGPDGYGITPFNAYRLLVSSVLDPDFTEFYRSGWENENTAEITQSVLDFEMPTNLRGQSTLVLRGSNDAISTDRMADEMVEAIRNRGGLSDKIEIPGAGHSPHTENMDRTLEAATNYLSKFRR